ncbi:MAG: hypothetical protein WAM73_00510 [Desulfobacterales bacterium]
MSAIGNPQTPAGGCRVQPEAVSRPGRDKRQVLYFLAADDTPVTARAPCWRRPLPLGPTATVEATESAGGPGVSYGDYFQAVHRFLTADRCAVLVGAVKEQSGRSVAPADLGPIRIYLEKHGQYYHPARVIVAVGNTRPAFVVNVAVTKTGRACLGQDYGNIRRLNDRFPYRFMPRVYGRGEAVFPGRCDRLEMFVGEWLEGYHEFHLSADSAGRAPAKSAGNECRLVVWDPDKGVRPLPALQQAEIYRCIALILTAYYDLESFEHIVAWHNAAGDFIVNTDGPRIDLRLITVRKYVPLFTDVPLNADTILQALLVFFLKLSIRIRLDRFDGVGAFGWADDAAVAAAVDGFFDGLALQARYERIPPGLPGRFVNYLKVLSGEDRDALFEGIVLRMEGPVAETALVREHLKRHGEELTQAIDRLRPERGPPTI